MPCKDVRVATVMAWLANNPGYEGTPERMAGFWDTIRQMAASGYLERSPESVQPDEGSEQQAAAETLTPLISRIHNLNKEHDPISL